MGVRHVTREQKQMARRLKSKGLTLKAIARELSCSLPLVTAIVYVQPPESGLAAVMITSNEVVSLTGSTRAGQLQSDLVLPLRFEPRTCGERE